MQLLQLLRARRLSILCSVVSTHTSVRVGRCSCGRTTLGCVCVCQHAHAAQFNSYCLLQLHTESNIINCRLVVRGLCGHCLHHNSHTYTHSHTHTHTHTSNDKSFKLNGKRLAVATHTRRQFGMRPTGCVQVDQSGCLPASDRCVSKRDPQFSRNIDLWLTCFSTHTRTPCVLVAIEAELNSRVVVYKVVCVVMSSHAKENYTCIPI